MRRGAKPHKAKVGAKVPITRKSRKSESSAVHDLEKRLAEALEQQTATAEILHVISSSPTDIQPVLHAVAQSATRLCEAYDAIISLRDGATLRAGAHHGPIPLPVETRPLSRDWVTGRTVVDRQVVHVHDLAASGAEFPLGQADAVRFGYRTTLGVPLLREGEAIGVIVIRRLEVRPFTAKQIALLQTFADQAVIAIENVRLFNETKEALERQTATSAILRVISRSATDIQPVLETIVEHAGRVCGAFDALVFLVEGGRLVRTAHRGPVPITEGSLSLPVDRDSASGLAVLECRTVHVKDFLASQEFPRGRAIAERSGFRTAVSVPLVKEEVAIGTLVVRRAEAQQPFTTEQIALLEIFADQAVIAIQNVRLFNETKEALEQQTATAEILRVISSSPTDVQPVFDAIVRSGTRLCGAAFGGAFRFDGQLLTFAAHHNASPGELEIWRRMYPTPATRGRATGRAIVDRRIIHIHDIREDLEYTSPTRQALGWRTVLAVPMLRDGEPIGALGLWRREVRPFTDKQIALMATFANQAVIAIENANLFKELQARTTELTRSVEQLTALGDVGRTLSSTLDLDTVLQTIVTRASQLAGTDACSVFEYDAATEAFHLRATHNLDEEVVALARRTPIRKGEGVQGRMAVTRQPVQIPDMAEEDAYRGPLRDVLLRTGTRAVLAIPMLREDQLIGGLTVNKKTPGKFSSEIIELLKTFATQSALAIQNARLFREIADKSRQLEAASQHKSEFLANMSHELRTPLNAIIGFSEVLTEHMFGELNEKQDEYLKDIYASGQHLLSLINDILDLSKIEAGRMELELADFDLPQAINNALTLVRERAGRRDIALHQAGDQRLGQIRGDERKIKQVLLNLLSNALKFTPEGGRVEVRAGIVDGRAEISVTDTGVGIAPEDQEAVFEEFRQVGTAAKQAEGTGLGLALSRRFIELHGGRIWVKSQVGVGSTFTFTMPLTIDQHHQTASPPGGSSA
jgi:signal transduction histidine kinase